MASGRATDDADTIGERQPLLSPPQQASTECMRNSQPQNNVPLSIKRRLYISHFLSTWNSRVFEFGAVLYLANIFPGTLLPMSLYAFARGLSAIIFAPAVGQYIDNGNRLQVVRVSIVVQRLVVATSCAIFYLLSINSVVIDQSGKSGLLILLSALACFEKLCSIMNMVSVEKDWVVVVVQKDQEELKTLNAQMRRIDLICKLLGPLFIALVDGYSTKMAVIVNFGMNLISVVVEYGAIARVYHSVPDLQISKKPKMHTMPAPSNADAITEVVLSPITDIPEGKFAHNWNHVKKSVGKYGSDFRLYFRHPACLPSVAVALLYLTVLNFAGQMVTYLLSSGYTSTQIGIARTLSVAFEVLATWVGPWLMGRIGPIRAGLWFSSWQVLSLITAIVIFWVYWSSNPILSASGLVVGTIISRLGLRGFDLCAQLIVQEDVEADNRGAFSSVEAVFQNAFELLSYASTMVFNRPDQFKYPALISVIAVTLASFDYSLFVRLRRGHLIHTEKIPLCGHHKNKQRNQEAAIYRITSRGEI